MQRSLIFVILFSAQVLGGGAILLEGLQEPAAMPVFQGKPPDVHGVVLGYRQRIHINAKDWLFVLRGAWDDWRFINAACWMLSRYARPVGMDAVREIGNRDQEYLLLNNFSTLIIAGMKRFPSMTKMQQSCAKALTAISLNNQNSHLRILKEGGINAMGASLNKSIDEMQKTKKLRFFGEATAAMLWHEGCDSTLASHTYRQLEMYDFAHVLLNGMMANTSDMRLASSGLAFVSRACCNPKVKEELIKNRFTERVHEIVETEIQRADKLAFGNSGMVLQDLDTCFSDQNETLHRMADSGLIELISNTLNHTLMGWTMHPFGNDHIMHNAIHLLNHLNTAPARTQQMRTSGVADVIKDAVKRGLCKGPYEKCTKDEACNFLKTTGMHEDSLDEAECL